MDAAVAAISNGVTLHKHAVLRKTWEMYADVPVSDIQTILQIVTLRMKI